MIRFNGPVTLGRGEHFLHSRVEAITIQKWHNQPISIQGCNKFELMIIDVLAILLIPWRHYGALTQGKRKHHTSRTRVGNDHAGLCHVFPDILEWQELVRHTVDRLIT